MTSYMERKRTHKRERQKRPNGDWIVAPLCHVQNLTTAYKASTDWREVDCCKCLAKRGKEKP